MKGSKRFGFTLAELLTAIFVGLVVCAVTTQAAGQAVRLMESISCRSLAWERGQNALSIIEPRAIHAALGITYIRDGDVFRRAFGDGENSPPPARWRDRGPLQILDGYPLALARNDGGVFRGRGIAILYAMPGEFRADLEEGGPVVISADRQVRVRLTPRPARDVMSTRLPVRDRSDLRSWVTFPLTGRPMHAVYSGGILTVSMGGSWFSGMVYPYDELHFLRAERFYVQREAMYSEELRTSWTQFETRLEGVLEMWFEWTPSKKFLEAWILTTGGRKTSGRTARPIDWPAAAPWREEFALHETAVARGSWVLKNM